MPENKTLTITLTEEEVVTLTNFIHFWHEGEDPDEYGGIDEMARVGKVFNKISRCGECFLDPNRRDDCEDNG
jgi:hypothetical protein